MAASYRMTLSTGRLEAGRFRPSKLNGSPRGHTKMSLKRRAVRFPMPSILEDGSVVISWTSEPERFILGPIHQMSGQNTQARAGPSTSPPQFTQNSKLLGALTAGDAKGRHDFSRSTMDAPVPRHRAPIDLCPSQVRSRPSPVTNASSCASPVARSARGPIRLQAASRPVRAIMVIPNCVSAPVCHQPDAERPYRLQAPAVL